MAEGDRYTFDGIITGDEWYGLREVTIADSAPAVGRSIVNLGLPPGVLLVLVYRAGQVVVPQGGTTLEAGDRVLLLAEGDSYDTARDLLAGSDGQGAYRGT